MYQPRDTREKAKSTEPMALGSTEKRHGRNRKDLKGITVESNRVWA